MRKTVIALAFCIVLALVITVRTSAGAERRQRVRRGRGHRVTSAISAKGVAATHKDVKYGSHDRNVMDIWIAESNAPTALVVYIHGGGFKSNSKSGIWGSRDIDRFLEKGISFATISYRYRDDSSEGILGSMKDARRAIQFLRSSAEKYNIDTMRIGTYGGSAGAGTSLWLAFHDDMADKKSSDPVLRESTRLAVVAAINTQATYNTSRWPEIVGDSDFVPAGATAPESKRSEVDMLAWMSKDDPPFLASNTTTKPDDYVHSQKHVAALKVRAKEVGLKSAAFFAPALRIKVGETDHVAFLAKHLL
jgi:hypothetical protein